MRAEDRHTTEIACSNRSSSRAQGYFFKCIYLARNSLYDIEETALEHAQPRAWYVR